MSDDNAAPYIWQVVAADPEQVMTAGWNIMETGLPVLGHWLACPFPNLCELEGAFLISSKPPKVIRNVMNRGQNQMGEGGDAFVFSAEFELYRLQNPRPTLLSMTSL